MTSHEALTGIISEKTSTELTEILRLTIVGSAMFATLSSLNNFSYVREEVTKQMKVCTEIMVAVKDKISKEQKQ